MEDPQTDARVRPARGVRLSDLDRSKPWVIGYTGRRWEVLGSIKPGLSVVEDLEVPGSTPDCAYCGCGSAGGPRAEAAQRRAPGDRASAPHTD
jgi:hypothetical protein